MSELPLQDPFREYHRGRKSARLLRFVAAGVGAAVLVLGLMYWPGASPNSPSSTVVVASGAPVAASATTPIALPTGSTAGYDTTDESTPVPSPQPDSAAQATLPLAGVASWTIEIATEGYQAELDQCLWVRMDIGAAAPIVGAHNNCGGAAVLEMVEGDTVVLSGVGLDGTYTVQSSRDAHAGDSAAAATSGWSADVILQTCYWNSGGLERLLALQRLTPALS